MGFPKALQFSFILEVKTTFETLYPCISIIYLRKSAATRNPTHQLSTREETQPDLPA